MNSIFIQFAIILGLASTLGYLTHKMKLPLLIAYLLGGLILVAAGFVDVKDSQVLSFLPEIGIAFVLFLVGMELDLRQLKSLGSKILIVGILQIIITVTLGTFIAQSFGFGLVEAIYLGIGLSFSSTIVVVKLLLEKKDINSLYGKLSVGILLLEDLLAVVILLGLTSQTSSSFKLGLTAALPILAFVIKVIVILTFTVILSKFILKSLFKAVSESTELLFLTALAWCFIYITFAQVLGFSVLIGAFLAGIALANSPYHFQIEGKVKPLRDLFLAIFFVYLGTKVDFSLIAQTSLLILAFTLYTTIIKPLVFLLILGIFGFRKHTLFHTAINLSQISEFSLIILLIGLNQGLVSESALTVIASSAVASIIISSLMIAKSNQIYQLMSGLVGFFERGKSLNFDASPQAELEDHVVVVGAHRVGGEIVKFLKREGINFIVVDFNPHQVEALLAEKISVIYGDIGDPDILEILKLAKARMVISTSPDVADNKALLEELKYRKIAVTTIVRAETIQDAQSLYKMGADYVIIPDILAGEALLNMLREHLTDKSYFKDRPRIELDKLSRKVLAWE